MAKESEAAMKRRWALEQKQYQAREDLRILSTAEQIKSDNQRMAWAKREALAQAKAAQTTAAKIVGKAKKK